MASAVTAKLVVAGRTGIPGASNNEKPITHFWCYKNDLNQVWSQSVSDGAVPNERCEFNESAEHLWSELEIPSEVREAMVAHSEEKRSVCKAHLGLHRQFLRVLKRGGASTAAVKQGWCGNQRCFKVVTSTFQCVSFSLL